MIHSKLKSGSIPWMQNTVVGGRPFKQAPTVAVIGDLMVDEYLDGVVQRVSPEAPVMVQQVKEVLHTAGGAANAARNIVTLGGQVKLFGVCGHDEAGAALKRLLEEEGVGSTYVLIAEDRPTVKKTRVRADQQQLIRIDWEECKPLPVGVTEQLYANLSKSSFDALLLSDYGKGCLSLDLIQAVVKLASDRQVPLLVDPKGKDFTRYEGCDLITPNYKEACGALGLDNSRDYTPEFLCRSLIERYALKDVLITLGKDGMVCATQVDGQLTFASCAAEARQVFDVSGAGDTVAAVMSLCLAVQLPASASMQVASCAAGVAVQKLGTAPVFWHELDFDSAPVSSHPTSLCKILSLEELVGRVSVLRAEGGRIVFTNGCFDLLHAGHVAYLEEARQRGDFLVVAVNDDASVRRLKGTHRPIVTLEQRQRVLAALSSVDFVLSFSQDTPLQVIEQLRPDVLVKAKDYLESEIVGADLVRAYGGEVARVDLVGGISTSLIEKSIVQNFKAQLGERTTAVNPSKAQSL
ncbi:MAG: D-glycero-beta-D-manno-heptose 1-phosphate adenylyltransferase [Zetaproteobacteria bacterium]|nr:D-glycero-beta-D-manno-heptose 1-phosphate adenylyltransferase [Zetaproteobacteria bacterium]